MHRLLIPIFLLAFSLVLQAQERDPWKRYTTEDFRIYYQEGEQASVNALTGVLKDRLFVLQSQLNYYLNNRVDVFVSSDKNEIDRLLKERRVLYGNQGGFIDVRQSDVKLYLGTPPQELLTSFSEQAARVIFNEMMYGGNMQDQMRSANLVYLPSWVESGLMHYLANGWDPRSDNQWRLVYERFGLKAFNRIPQEYDALKGASFFKYIEDHYGKASLSNLLYMARLTRKFSTALQYAFQKSSTELYRDWWRYFDQAYTIDQRKRLPVNGLELDASDVRDICVVSTDMVLVVKEHRSKLCLEQWNENGFEKEYHTVAKTSQTLPDFKGSIQYDDQGIHWFLFDGEELTQHTFNDGALSTRKVQIERVGSIYKEGANLYVLCPGLVNSRWYRWESTGLQLIQEWDVFVQEAVPTDQGPLALCAGLDGSSFVLRDETDTLLPKNGEMRQLVVRDSLLYYLANTNGVFNAKRLDLRSGHDVYLTDYRSDILFHSIQRGYLAEYINELDRSALYVSEFGREPELIYFDSIHPTFFRQALRSDVLTEAGTTEAQLPDSMPSYRFQTPFPEDKDFVFSNYDSLKAEADERSRFVATQSSAINRFKRHSVFVQLYNEHNGQASLPYVATLPSYAPNRLSLRLGGTVLNQFNDQMLYGSYMVFPRVYQEFDVALRYFSWKGGRPFQVGLAQRHRTRLVDAETVQRDQSSFFDLRWNWWRSTSWTLSQRVDIRYDEGVRLGSQSEVLRANNMEKGQLALPLRLQYERPMLNRNDWQVSASITAKPFYQMPEGDLGGTFLFDAQLKKQLLGWLDIEGRWQAGASWGEQPEFFVLGGTSTDVLSNWYERSFTGAFLPSYYTMVYGIRGFDVNYRNGTSFGTSMMQVGLSPVKLFVPRPVYSAFLNQMRIVAFTDLGYSMYGSNYYDRSNALNEEEFSTPGASYTIQVRNVRNPLVASGGFGVHTELYSYRIAVDWAYGFENSKIRPPKLHISIAQYF